METLAMYPVIRRIRMTIIGWGSTMVREALPEGTIGHTAIPSTIIGRAVSTGRMRITTDMMTAMTDSGTKGSFDNKGFQNFRFQLF